VLSSEDAGKLIEAGMLGKVEIWDGRVTMGGLPVGWSPEQVDAAAEVAVRLDPEPHADAPTITADQYTRLVGIIDKIELIDGKVVCADGPLAFTPRQARDAAARGVPVWSCVDAVLADPAAVKDLLDRMAADPDGRDQLRAALDRHAT
jgi:hypothetical protein